MTRRRAKPQLLAIVLILAFPVLACGGTITPSPVTATPSETPLPILRVAIQAGHGRGDAGAAICSIAPPECTMASEAAVNLAIANMVAEILGQSARYEVSVFQGRDPAIQGLQADAFVAIHADQGLPGRTGYKVSRYGGEPGSGLDASGDASDQLATALWDEYGRVTGLDEDREAGHYPPRMTQYYALAWVAPETPAVIIEAGWLCDDLPVLVGRQDLAALGIAMGISRFLGGEPPALPPSMTTPVPACDMSQVPSPTATATPTELQSETIFLDTRDQSARSSIDLADGHWYSLEISGTFSYWDPEYWAQWGICAGAPDPSPLFQSPDVANGPAGQDAFYFYAFPRGDGTTQICGIRNPPFLGDFLEISTNGGASYYMPNPPPFDTSHTYRTLVLGRAQPLLVRLNDSYYPDNRGQIMLEITP